MLRMIHCSWLLIVFFILITPLYGQGKLSRLRDATGHRKQESGNATSKDDQNRPNGRRHRKKRKRRRSYFGPVTFPVQVTEIREVHVVRDQLAPESDSDGQPEVYHSVFDASFPAEYPATEPKFTPVVPAFLQWSTRLTATGGTDFDDVNTGQFGLLVNPHGAASFCPTVLQAYAFGFEFFKRRRLV